MVSPSSSSKRPRPVIVVTGANSGVGFGICQRLLVQLSSPTPSDTLPCHPGLVSKRLTAPDAPLDPLPSPFAAPDGCTLVLACRNAIKAHQARARLQAMLETLHDLPDDAEPPSSAPPPSPHQRARLGQIDEDEDPAVLAQAAEASIRRRRVRRDNVAAAEAAAAAAVAAGSPGSDPAKTIELLLYGDDGTEDEAQAGGESSDVMRGAGGRPLTPKEREDRARVRYRRRFCRRTRIEFVALDLGSMASALGCAKEITERYGYVTHIVLNAGAGAWAGINWPKAAWMMATGFVNAVTWPKYKLQRSGDIGKDGYGWVWQANVGAHYVLVRALLPALRATPYSTPSRIIWTGSIEAEQRFYQIEDPECKDPLVSLASYESTKYQCELAGLGLEAILSSRNRLATQPSTPAIEWDPVTGSATAMTSSGSNDSARRPSPSPSAFGSFRSREPKSFVTHPGVVASSIFAEYLNTILDLLMKLGFYIARWLFSPNHPIIAYKGAIASCHVALAPLPSLDPSIRYGSCTDWFGREYVHLGRVDGWVPHPITSTFKDLLGLRKKPSERPEAEGKRVMELARGVVEYCESVARDVWREAQAGSLPPFSELEPDFAEGAAMLLLPSHTHGAASSGVKPQQKATAAATDAEAEMRRRKDSDSSSWEKVNEAC